MFSVTHVRARTFACLGLCIYNTLHRLAKTLMPVSADLVVLGVGGSDRTTHSHIDLVPGLALPIDVPCPWNIRPVKIDIPHVYLIRNSEKHIR